MKPPRHRIRRAPTRASAAAHPALPHHREKVAAPTGQALDRDAQHGLGLRAAHAVHVERQREGGHLAPQMSKYHWVRVVRRRHFVAGQHILQPRRQLWVLHVLVKEHLVRGHGGHHVGGAAHVELVVARDGQFVELAFELSLHLEHRVQMPLVGAVRRLPWGKGQAAYRSHCACLAGPIGDDAEDLGVHLAKVVEVEEVVSQVLPRLLCRDVHPLAL